MLWLPCVWLWDVWEEAKRYLLVLATPSCSLSDSQWRHQGGHGAFANPSQRLCLPPTCLPTIRRKNGKNQPFLAIFFIFAPSKIHFAPLDAPQKFLVLPLVTTCDKWHPCIWLEEVMAPCNSGFSVRK